MTSSSGLLTGLLLESSEGPEHGPDATTARPQAASLLVWPMSLVTLSKADRPVTLVVDPRYEAYEKHAAVLWLKEKTLMPDVQFTVAADELPEPGEIAEVLQGGYLILIENTTPPGDAAEAEEGGSASGEVIKYVLVNISAPASVVRHAAAVYQRNKRTRVWRWTLCSRNKSRAVARRLDAEPLTNVTCAQCRKYLVSEGLLAD